MEIKINCKNIKQTFNSICCNIKRNISNKNTTFPPQPNSNKPSLNTCSTLEVHENNVLADKLLLDIRTYICAHGKCHLHYNRSHRRLSNFNWNKILTLSPDINKVIRLANKIVTAETLTDKVKNDASTNRTEQQTNNIICVYCNNPKLVGIIHTHFVRETNIEGKNLVKQPIESVFSHIDKKANEFSNKIKSKGTINPPGKPNVENNYYRMSYGDINYLGNNKALLYFNRGTRGTQIFTNSMSPLERQPKHNDLIVLDDIVFTSTCKCDSALQHKQMFPHYRVTCAVGLTCPARLNNIEKEIYRRSRNAPTEMYTTARSMLVRYWR